VRKISFRQEISRMKVAPVRIALSERTSIMQSFKQVHHGAALEPILLTRTLFEFIP
jgi:hypothetical protein